MRFNKSLAISSIILGVIALVSIGQPSSALNGEERYDYARRVSFEQDSGEKFRIRVILEDTQRYQYEQFAIWIERNKKVITIDENVEEVTYEFPSGYIPEGAQFQTCIMMLDNEETGHEWDDHICKWHENSYENRQEVVRFSLP